MDHLPTPFHSHPSNRTASNLRPPIISRYHSLHMRNLVGCSVIPRRLYIWNVMRVMLAASTAGQIRNTHTNSASTVTKSVAHPNPNQYIKSCSIVLPLPVFQYGAPMHAPRSNCEIPDRLSQSGYAEAYPGSSHSFQNHRARVDGLHAAVSFNPDEANAVLLSLALRIRHGIKAIDDFVRGAFHPRLHLAGVVGCVGWL